MSVNKLATTLNISTKEAEDLFEKYAKAFPNLDKWLKNQAKFGYQKGYILLNDVHKGRRYFPDFRTIQNILKYTPQSNEIKKLKGIIERASMNTPIQGTGAVIMKHALVETRKYIIENGYYDKDVFLIATVHDQLDMEVRKDLAEKVLKDVSQIMTDVGNLYVTKVNMAVDGDINEFWKK